MKVLRHLVVLPFSISTLFAQDRSDDWVRTTDQRGDFALAQAGRVADLVLGPNDFKVVSIAAADLASDLARVTGQAPSVRTVRSGGTTPVVLIGTLGRNPAIDALVEAGKLDVSALREAWESFVIATVDTPLPGVKSGLVVVGSDRRGTAFGVYELSQAIGVSPWHWWADVTPAKRATLFVKGGTPRFGPPSVKYRGIADDYGIVMGSSHAEPMLRNNVSEWKAPPETYNDLTNRAGVRAYWEERVRENGRFESIYTLGMRGIHDSNMQGPKTDAERIETLEQIFADQRDMLVRHISPLIERIPQMFCADKPRESPRPAAWTDVEAEARLRAFADLKRRSEAVRARVPAARLDSFVELVHYPVTATALANERFIAGERGQTETARAADAHALLKRLTAEFQDLASGKWRGLISLEPADPQWSSMRIAPWAPPWSLT